MRSSAAVLMARLLNSFPITSVYSLECRDTADVDVSFWSLLISRSLSADDLASQHGAILSMSQCLILGVTPSSGRLLDSQHLKSFASSIIQASTLLTHPTIGISQKMLGWDLIAGAILELITSICQNIISADENSRYQSRLNSTTWSKILIGIMSEPSATVDEWMKAVLLALGSRDESLHELCSLKVIPAIIQCCEFFRNQTPSTSSMHGPSKYSPLDGTLTADTKLDFWRQKISDFYRLRILPAADKDRNIHVQRGCTLAIGTMPPWLADHRRVPLSRLLIKMINPGSVSGTFSAPAAIEKRVNALKSFLNLMGHIIPLDSTDPLAIEIRDALIFASTDYTVDSRGDVGSLIRRVLLENFGDADFSGSKFCESLMSLNLITHMAGFVIRHLFDRLDRLRADSLRAVSCTGPISQMILSQLNMSVHDFGELNLFWNRPELLFSALKTPLLYLFGSRSSMWDCALRGIVSSAGSPNMIISAPAQELLLHLVTKKTVPCCPDAMNDIESSKSEHEVDVYLMVSLLLECTDEKRLWRSVLGASAALLTPDRLASSSISSKSSPNGEGPLQLLAVWLINQYLMNPGCQSLDLVTVSKVMVNLKPYILVAAEWVSKVGTSHECSRVRQICCA
jgi:hypothetical protein